MTTVFDHLNPIEKFHPDRDLLAEALYCADRLVGMGISPTAAAREVLGHQFFAGLLNNRFIDVIVARHAGRCGDPGVPGRPERFTAQPRDLASQQHRSHRSAEPFPAAR